MQGDHGKVEQDQWFTFAVMHIFAAALRKYGLPLERFNAFATLNAELATLLWAGRLDKVQSFRLKSCLLNQEKWGVLLITDNYFNWYTEFYNFTKCSPEGREHRAREMAKPHRS